MKRTRSPRTAVSPEAAALGAQIKRRRLRLGLTGDEVHKLSGIDPTTLSFFERGVREPRPTHLRRLASVLGLTFKFAPAREA